MPAYHIHITGLVQGVGFRPLVHKQAILMHMQGWVSNGSDGVHIYCKGEEENVQQFYTQIIQNPPSQAIITEHSIAESNTLIPAGFHIKQSTHDTKLQMLLTPDLCICDDCKRAINDPTNKRYQYPFTTCLNCGPRYSIITAIPYDRQHTTMQHLHQCESCKTEYNNVMDLRHHSQTNSCPQCAIKMHLFDNTGNEIECAQSKYLDKIKTLLQLGNIIAVKGTGGYLFMCDATQPATIKLLRERKNRPSKPFAVLYADLDMLHADLAISSMELTTLKHKSAPIVLCQLKQFPENNISTQQIAPGLNTIGAMLPSTPLLQLIAHQFGKPLIATSANLSGSPIIYNDQQAQYWLSNMADYMLSYDREIMAPQDDSVVQISSRGQKIILRRSRGLAPNYYPLPFPALPTPTLAMGAELKSAFAIAQKEFLFISQFLGDQETVEAQDSYVASLKQVSNLLGFEPEHILADKHPSYQVTQRAQVLANKYHCDITHIQHHEAHFAAVLAENNLLQEKEPILGFIWDGAGLGDDGQIWGGEVFLFDQDEITRTTHLAYFPQLMGNKMNKEPRLSALSILSNFPKAQQLIRKYFTDKEWLYYTQVLHQPQTITTSSMGRLIDAVACLLGIKPTASYEGEAAMQLEAMARNCTYHGYDYYHLPLVDGVIDWRQLINELIHDWSQKESNEIIAWKFFYSLAKLIARISNHYYIDKLAFSGGVFQNALLVDMIIELLQHKRQLYFHQQVSPNDECISLGQLAWFSKFGNTKKIKTENSHIQQAYIS